MELRIAIVEDQKFEAQQLKTQENFLVCNRGLLLNRGCPNFCVIFRFSTLL